MPENIQDTLAQRGSRYGDFAGHAQIAQHFMTIMTTSEKTSELTGKRVKAWDRLDAVKAQALTVICDKIARILNGDPEYDDNWRDIIGYATLAMERLKVPPVAAAGINLGYEPTDRADALQWIVRIKHEMPNDTIATNRIRQIQADFDISGKDVGDYQRVVNYGMSDNAAFAADVLRRTHEAHGSPEASKAWAGVDMASGYDQTATAVFKGDKLIDVVGPTIGRVDISGSLKAGAQALREKAESKRREANLMDLDEQHRKEREALWARQRDDRRNVEETGFVVRPSGDVAQTD